MNTQASKVIAECAKQREASQATKQLTVQEALQYAAWLERTPDAITTTQELKDCVRALHAAMQSSRCFYKAVERGEEVFVLRQPDRAAPDAIVVWAGVAREHGCQDAKVDDAYRMAARWRAQPEAMTKWPD